jgi:hypothetical protein
MPGRKLSQADLDDLREADDELMLTKQPIVRKDNRGAGENDVILRTQKDLVEWKGISESHFHTHKRNGWKLRRGVPYEDKPIDTVPAEVLRTTFDLFQERLEAKDRRIAELEAELEQLRRKP